MKPEKEINFAARYPFDAPDAWWDDGNDTPPPPARDMPHAKARAIIANLQDRRGIKNELSRDNIDEATRAEIINEIAAIIAHPP